ncbi:hypothetical protein [Ruegeria atlantica]|uniref:hypothetical protein n=1 Tax=Ruegeria atlantica TaxID=81569 RepID=UPI000A519DE8|nr:hypothetical protein [Ruegeria atlantica]
MRQAIFHGKICGEQLGEETKEGRPKPGRPFCGKKALGTVAERHDVQIDAANPAVHTASTQALEPAVFQIFSPLLAHCHFFRAIGWHCFAMEMWTDVSQSV